ncbi:hypothetical protein Q7C36_022617 [Tachysurus vachellii]|uniref:UBC core domain-containing protein n=1 Tax=Tachysurus vachellii TaxID=175792 RepID=A0AA88LKS9_TACVA|nr:hypothetical protein Q7C36_022617 [Tachysurus vachellii]
MTEPQSALLLRRQLAELNKNPVEGFSAGLIDDNDLYRWEVLIIGPPDTLYEGGVFKAHLTFPKDYPLRPPKMKFITEIWHPNVDKNGDLIQTETPLPTWMQQKSGGKTDMANSRGKLLVVYERAKRRPLTDIHPAACSITNFRVSSRETTWHCFPALYHPIAGFFLIERWQKQACINRLQ